MYEIIYQDIEENKEYEATIKKVVEKCFEEEGISASKLCLTITLTTPENIKKINKKIRSVVCYTLLISKAPSLYLSLQDIKHKKNCYIFLVTSNMV